MRAQMQISLLKVRRVARHDVVRQILDLDGPYRAVCGLEADETLRHVAIRGGLTGSQQCAGQLGVSRKTMPIGISARVLFTRGRTRPSALLRIATIGGPRSA
jgi:hypothetical protein